MPNKSWRAVLGAAMILFATSALAQVVELHEGDSVFDGQGGEVGVVRKVTDSVAVIWTGSVKVTLGRKSFTLRSGQINIAMTRSELQKAAEGVQAKGDDELLVLLTPGSSVYDPDGAIAATVDNVAGKDVTVVVGTLKASMPVSAFVKGPKGAQIDLSAADFKARIEEQRAVSAAPVELATEAPPKAD